MTWEELRRLVLRASPAPRTFPFEPRVSVFKAANGKMFAISAASSEPLDVSVKCDPELAEALRAAVRSRSSQGYHLNKCHWITITLGSDVPDERVKELVADSYHLVRPRQRPR